MSWVNELGQSQINKRQESKQLVSFMAFHSAILMEPCAPLPLNFHCQFAGGRASVAITCPAIFLGWHWVCLGGRTLESSCECLWNWKQLAKCAGDLERNVIALIAHTEMRWRGGRTCSEWQNLMPETMQKLHPWWQEQGVSQWRINWINKGWGYIVQFVDSAKKEELIQLHF